MSRTEELIRRSQAGEGEATEQLVQENAGLIWSVAKRFLGRGTEAEDLYQLGCVGFLKAVEGFDLQFGTQFSTYAVPKIAGEIRRFLRDDGPMRVSRSLKEQGSLLRGARAELCAELGREPSLSELSLHTGLSPEDIAAAETAMDPVISLQCETGDGGLTLEGLLTSGNEEETMVERIALRCALKQLPEQEQKVLLLRYYKGLTQSRSAAILGVSQVQVSRLERRAIEKLRQALLA